MYGVVLREWTVVGSFGLRPLALSSQTHQISFRCHTLKNHSCLWSYDLFSQCGDRHWDGIACGPAPWVALTADDQQPQSIATATGRWIVGAGCVPSCALAGSATKQALPGSQRVAVGGTCHSYSSGGTSLAKRDGCEGKLLACASGPARAATHQHGRSVYYASLASAAVGEALMNKREGSEPMHGGEPGFGVRADMMNGMAVEWQARLGRVWKRATRVCPGSIYRSLAHINHTH